MTSAQPRHPPGLFAFRPHRLLYESLNVVSGPVIPLLRSRFPSFLSIPALCSVSLAPSTLESYHRALSDYYAFKDFSPSFLDVSDPLRFSAYIVSLFSNLRWTSVDSIITRYNQLSSALSYTDTPLRPSNVLTRLRKALSKLSSFDVQSHAPALPPADFLALVRLLANSGELEGSAVLCLCWIGAFRLSDCIRIPSKAIDFNVSPPTVQLNWQKNQLSARQKLPIGSSPLLEILRAYALSRSLSPQFFQTSVRHVRYLLEKHSLVYRGHSLRRGALQAMAAQGVSSADLLLVSRHRSLQQLLRYLRETPADLSARHLQAQKAAL